MSKLYSSSEQIKQISGEVEAASTRYILFGDSLDSANEEQLLLYILFVSFKQASNSFNKMMMFNILRHLLGV
jgi:hypothetical protein